MDARELLIETLPMMPPLRALEGLSEADVARRLPGAPHSIGEIVAHMEFWQDWLVGRANGSGTPMPGSAAAGWPVIGEGEWPELLRRFRDGLDRAVALGAFGDAMILPPFDTPPMAHYTAADVVAHIANHNAHHLGQVILLRQMMGVWPPPGGSWTW